MSKILYLLEGGNGTVRLSEDPADDVKVVHLDDNTWTVRGFLADERQTTE